MIARRGLALAATLSLCLLVTAGAAAQQSKAPPSPADAATLASRSVPTSTVSSPSRLLVTAEEWLYRLSRPKLRAGNSVIQLFNRGEDVHDLRVRRLGRSRVIGTPETAPGDVARLRTKLRRGRYALWCAIPGHRALGMEAELKVRKRR